MKIGIIGSGVIVKEALLWTSQISTVECTALCCRPQDRQDAEELQRQYGFASLYTDLDEFLKNDSFDTVYVGVINSLHYFNARKALDAGKNVICEKPFVTKASQAKELYEVAKDKHLFLFEGMMLRYNENYQLIKDSIPELGDIKMVLCNYSQYSRRYDKYLEGTVLPAFDPDLAGGCLMDINVYAISFVMGLFGMPKAWKYYPSIGFNGIDVNGIMVLDYGSFKAMCCAAKDSNSKPFCSIQGTKGYISMESMPSMMQNMTKVFNKQDPIRFGSYLESPMKNEFIKISDMMARGDYSTCYQYIENTIDVVTVMEKARIEAGILFKGE